MTFKNKMIKLENIVRNMSEVFLVQCFTGISGEGITNGWTADQIDDYEKKMIAKYTNFKVNRVSIVGVSPGEAEPEEVTMFRAYPVYPCKYNHNKYLRNYWKSKKVADAINKKYQFWEYESLNNRLIRRAKV